MANNEDSKKQQESKEAAERKKRKYEEYLRRKHSWRKSFENFIDIADWTLAYFKGPIEELFGMDYNEFIHAIEEASWHPHNIDLLGNTVFENILASKAGWGWRNLNKIKNRDTAFGRLLRREKLIMGYTKRSGRKTSPFPFRFHKAPKSLTVLKDLVPATNPLIDNLIVPPSDREKVSKPRDEDCYFVELKTGLTDSQKHLSPNQKEKFPDIAEHVNLSIVSINLGLEPEIHVTNIDD